MPRIEQFLFLLFINTIFCQFNINLDVINTDNYRLQSQISLEKKRVYVQVDLTSTNLQVCCKPNHNIFQIIHSFLINPFFQINQYTCPSTQRGQKNSQINLPTIGVIEMNHSIVESPSCSIGKIGLNKRSVFLNYLPVNAHTIKIQVNQVNSPKNNKITIQFGQINTNIQPSKVYPSPHRQYWNVIGKQIQLGSLMIQKNPKVIFTSSGPSIKIPLFYYQKITLYFPSNQTCKMSGQKLLCLCQSGIPIFFPKFLIFLQEYESLQISPEIYMESDSNICKMLFQPSKDQNWYFNVWFFKNRIFYFDLNQKKIMIQKKQITHNQSSQLINLPIPLILNCAVVLLLCIFVSLVIIELTKCISGFSQIRDQTLHEYIIRTNINQQ